MGVFALRHRGFLLVLAPVYRAASYAFGSPIVEPHHEPPARAPGADAAFGRIEYLDRGRGRPVLVVHGSPGGHDQSSLMADFVVAAGLRAIIPSRPGYLGSALNDANRSIDGARRRDGRR